MLKIVAETEGFALGKILPLQLGAGPRKVGVKDVVVFVDIDASGVVPQSVLKRPGSRPKQVIAKVHIAGAGVEIDDAQLIPFHRGDVVAIMHHVVNDLRIQMVERAAAAEVAGEETRVARPEHAVVEMVMGKKRGHVVHRPAVARGGAGAVPVEIEEVLVPRCAWCCA